MLKGMSRSRSEKTPPTAAIGMPVKTRSACRIELKVEKRSRKIRKSDRGTTMRRRFRARSRFSNCPPNSTR
jgi:hypothetical protein